MLLFGRRPQRQISYAYIAAARFPGVDTSADPADRTDLSGRLLDVLDRATAYLDTHLRAEHRIRGLEPERHPELPEVALREAVVNALAHRDYTVRGPVRLFVLDGRVEAHTPGAVPNTIDEAAMRADAHVERDPAIYARLSDAGLVTRAGTGIRRMIRLVREPPARMAGSASTATRSSSAFLAPGQSSLFGLIIEHTHRREAANQLLAPPSP